jgi:hypothetical protein
MYTNHSSPGYVGLDQRSFVGMRIRYSLLQQTVPPGVPMAFDENLAARVRDALARRRNVEAKKMFGCICFFINGNALAGVWKDRLIARLGPDEGEAALLELHVQALDITGRPMKNWVAVEPEGVGSDDQLKGWIQRAIKFVGKLPAK